MIFKISVKPDITQYLRFFSSCFKACHKGWPCANKQGLFSKAVSNDVLSEFWCIGDDCQMSSCPLKAAN